MAVTDIAMTGFGAPWGHTRIYNNQLEYDFDYGNGWNWMVSQWGYLVQGANGTIGVVRSPRTTIWFEPAQGGGYTPMYGATYSLLQGSSVMQMVVPSGAVWEFNDFIQTTNPQGSFKSLTLPGNQGTLSVTSYNSFGQITEVQRTSGTITQSLLYTYAGSSLISVLLRKKDTSISSNWVDLRQVAYEYYDVSSTHGSAGDLKTAVHQQYSGTSWEDTGTYYYRYYLDSSGDGFQYGLKYAFEPQAYQAMIDDGINPLTAADSTVEPYADYYFKYNSDRRVTSEIVEAGTQTYTFDYVTSSLAKDYNNWTRRTVETRPDGSAVTVFTNFLGQVILRSLMSGSDEWNEYQRFDANGHLELKATPAAVASYTYVDTSTALTVTLNPTSGLIHWRDYYPATDNSGAAKWYPSSENI